MIPAANTTPESFVVQKYFRKMVDAGCDCVVMEVSSQGLMLHRTQGFVFDFGIFTNIEPDHIGPNEHKDFDDYLRCKSLLLKQCRTGIVTGMMSILRKSYRDIPVSWRLMDFHRRQTFAQKMHIWSAARDIWEFPTMSKVLWTSR